MNLPISIAIILMVFCFPVVHAGTDSLKTCSYQFRGHVSDGKDPLMGAAVFIHTLNKGDITNENGEFKIAGVCAGSYRVTVSYIGFKSFETTLSIKKSTHLDFNLQADTSLLESVLVTAKRQEYFTQTQPIASITARELDNTRGLSLGESLKQIPGVNTIQTGPNISKPMIQGLHSNRILIINNGVRQEGQQWGSEHAPEIDPFIAAKLTVIKGASSIRYGSDAMGGVVLAEPKEFRVKSGIGGEANLVGMSNGRLGAVSTLLEGAFDKKLTGLAWRIQGTGRRAGNFRTADYYMENTGLRESNFSAALAYRRKRGGGEIYYSSFDTQLGIFTGSEAGNKKDIEAAIARSRPITPSYFSYAIGRPNQQVWHQLFKASGFVVDKNGNKLEMIFARQYNDRAEYGLIPITGSSLPQLHLQIETYTLDLMSEHALTKNIMGKIGFNGIAQSNRELTGSLNPDFKNFSGGIFVIEKWNINCWTIEGGFRYDYRWLRVYQNDALSIAGKTYNYKNVTGSLGGSYHLSDHFIINANASTAWRAPTVSELYANGIEIGAAGFVRGNSSMKQEQAYNFIASLNYQGKYAGVEIGAYRNVINHYIFLNPGLSYVNTKVGEFPLLTYTQADVTFYGADAAIKLNPIKSLTISSKTSLVLAYNNTIHDYLVLTPANRFDHSIKYMFGKVAKLKELYVSVSHLYVSQQKRVPANSDYAPPPAGYHLLGADVGFDVPVGHQHMSINIGVANMLNISYRDYLNRFRYYTDDPGRNFTIRIKMPFEVVRSRPVNLL